MAVRIQEKAGTGMRIRLAAKHPSARGGIRHVYFVLIRRKRHCTEVSRPGFAGTAKTPQTDAYSMSTYVNSEGGLEYD